MKRLPPALAADALRRALRRHPREPGDPAELVLTLRRWLRAASLDRRGWRCALVAGRPVLIVRGRVHELLDRD